MNNSKWSVEKHGCNIATFRNQKEKIVVTLEYDFNYKGFRELSKYIICNKYTYNNRVYDRNKPNNKSRYYKILSTIPIETWQKAYELF